MAPLQVLFLGGTGCISRWCVRRALEAGHRVLLLTRGRRPDDFGDAVTRIQGEKNAPGDLARALAAAGGRLDVVADFLSYTPQDLTPKFEVFADRVGQYMFISSATVYEKPPAQPTMTEATRRHNPFSASARNKIACEDALARQRALPFPIGDGTTLWTMTHASDFAAGFVGLFGRDGACGEAFHIVGDELLPWNRLVELTAEAAGATPQIVHIASDRIVAIEPSFEAGLFGDKIHTLFFNTTKIRGLVPAFRTSVPFAEGIRRSLAFLDAHSEHRHVNAEMDAKIDRVLSTAGEM